MDDVSQKNKRAIKLGLACAVAIVASVLLMDFFDHWSQVRQQIQVKRQQLLDKAVDARRNKQLAAQLTAFEMPQDESDQHFLFRDKLAEQLKTAGIKGEPLQGYTSRPLSDTDYHILSLEAEGPGKFSQALDLLAKLYENPYLMALQKFKLQTDPKNGQNTQIELKVSTLAR